MNDLLIKKAEAMEQKALKLIRSQIKKMGWGIALPFQLQDLIMTFLYHSFLRPLKLFVRVLPPCPIGPSNEYVLESGEGILKIQGLRQWRSINNVSMFRIKILQQFFRTNFLADIFQETECKFIGRPQESYLITGVVEYFRAKRKGTIDIGGLTALKTLMNRNILTFKSQVSRTFIADEGKPIPLEDLGTIRYAPSQDLWTMEAPLIWRSASTVSRKKQIVRLSPTSLLEIEGTQARELPPDHFSQQTSAIAYVLP